MAIIDSLKKISDTIWELPRDYKAGMRCRRESSAPKNYAGNGPSGLPTNHQVATFPGIEYAICMPDGHSGYGFPIGGVAAMDTKAALSRPADRLRHQLRHAPHGDEPDSG